jgi:phage tail-like protein
MSLLASGLTGGLLGGISSRALTWRFRVEIPGIVKNVVVAEFVEVNGLDVERETTTLAVGGQNDAMITLPGRVKYSNITLRRGLIDLSLLEWLMNQVDTGTIKPNPKDLTISLADESNMVVYVWDVAKAWPVKWTGPQLRADSSEIAMERLDLAHMGFKLRVGDGLGLLS